MSPKKHRASERKLTVTWDDPLIGAETSKNMTGLDYLPAIERGDLPPPPIARLLGFRLIGVDFDQAVREMRRD